MPRIRLFNPKRARRAKPRRRNKTVRKSNAAEGGLLTYMANPRKARRRNRRIKTNPRRRRNRNPFGFGAARKHAPRIRRRRRANPFGFGTQNLTQLAKDAAYAVGGGILTRALPETFLRDKNKGLVGYAANGAVAVGLSLAAGKMGGPQAQASALLGGAVMLGARIFEDYTGKKLVEFGNLPFQVPGLSGDPAYNLAGDFYQANFPVPQSSLGPESRPKVCPVLPPAPAVAGKNGMSGSGVAVWRDPWS